MRIEYRQEEKRREEKRREEKRREEKRWRETGPICVAIVLEPRMNEEAGRQAVE